MLFLRQVEPNIRRYLPPFIFSDKTVDAIAKTNNSEHEALRHAVADVANQFYVETATWGLANWERVLGIPTVTSDGYEARRKRILLKLQSHQVSTKKFMLNLINRYTNDDSGFLIEHNEDNWLEYGVNIDGVGNWRELVGAINTYKPAHLGVYLVLRIIQKVEFLHVCESVQTIESRHNFWNLGALHYVMRDGEFDRDAVMRRGGIYPNEQYRELQVHAAEAESIVDAWHYAPPRQSLRCGLEVITFAPVAIHQNAIERAELESYQEYKKYHEAETETVTECRQNKDTRLINCRDGSFCRDGTHTRNDSFINQAIMQSYCTVTYSKNGIEVTETL